MLKMAEYVGLERIIDLLENKGQQNMTYLEFKPTFEEKVKRVSYLEKILNNAMDLLFKDEMSDTFTLDSLRLEGTSSNQNKCNHC